MTKFKEGDKVRHIDNELIIRVVSYQTRKEKAEFDMLAMKQYYKSVLTGKVVCSWVDESNKRHEEAFLESELVFVN